MKFSHTEWWVEYDIVDGIAMKIKVFRCKEEAEDFAREHNSKVIQSDCYKC